MILNISAALESEAEPTFPSTDPNVLVAYSNSCDPRLLEFHGSSHNLTQDNSHIGLLIFAAVALILEAVALAVLARPAATRFGSMRRSLVAMTAVEMWLSSTIFIHKAWEEFTTEPNETFTHFCLSFLLFSALNAAICSRNWVVTLIALARCEAITRPVATRVSTHIFSPRRQAYYIGILIVCSIGLSIYRLAIRKILVCTNLGDVVFQIGGNQTNSMLRLVSEKIFFAYQSAIPIIVVTISTLFMMVVLLRHRMPTEMRKDRSTRRENEALEQDNAAERRQDGVRPVGRETGRINRGDMRGKWKWRGCGWWRTEADQIRVTERLEEDGGCVVSTLQAVRQAQRRSNQMRATRFILFIATVFILCEAPVFFAVVCVSSMPRQVVIQVFTYLRFLIIADSFANFAIYLLTSRLFRTELVNMLMCRSIRPSVPRNFNETRTGIASI